MADLDKKTKIIAIAGPTASGKSGVAMMLCQKTGFEIVSCDSMQIYRGMDIGTAKPTKEDMMAVRHHMIDVADPRENFSCAEYASMASRCIDDIHSRGNIPVICGGTGMYFERLVMTDPILSPTGDERIREELSLNTNEYNHALLERVDPESAKAIHMNNRKRVIRALEIYLSSGKTKTEWDKLTQQTEPKYDLRHITLVSEDREYLYDRIDRRVDIMLEEGLEEEVRELCLDASTTAGQAIGYKEMSEYISGFITLEEAVSKIKQGSRNYAKRQLTWFRRYKNACFLDIDHGEKYEKIVNFAISLVE